VSFVCVGCATCCVAFCLLETFSLLRGHGMPPEDRILPLVDAFEPSCRLSDVSSQNDSSPSHSADEAENTAPGGTDENTCHESSFEYTRGEGHNVNRFSAPDYS